MSGTTTNFSWPFPTNGDVANVAVDMAALAAAADSTLGDAWTTYTPTWTAVTANPVLNDGTITGRFKRFANWGVANGIVTMGAATTFGTGAYRFSLPAGWTMRAPPNVSIRGHAGAFDASTGTYYVGYVAYVSGGTTVSVRTHAATAEVGTTVPVTWANGDNIAWQVLVELQ